MKEEFVFTKDLAKKLDTHEKMAYAIKYGLGRATKAEDAEFAEIAEIIDKANRAASVVTAEELKEIIGYLNKKCGTVFKPSAKETVRHINARFAEGYTVEDFKEVIDSQAVEWADTKQEQYLRPMTLFGTKFASYLSYAKVKKQRGEAEASKGSFDTDVYFDAALQSVYGEERKA